MKKQISYTLLVACAALIMPGLQGCFPLVAAGVGAGALSIADRRTTGAQIDDEAIEGKVSARFREQFGSAQYQVDATSYNRRVLLTGQAATAQIKEKLAAIAKDVPNVASVTNEVVVSGSSTFGSRSNDGLITSNVKARFLTHSDSKFAPNHVKVTTEDGVVYLMGIVTPAEGEAAAEVARTSSGVRQVVKVFEYIDKAPEPGTAAK